MTEEQMVEVPLELLRSVKDDITNAINYVNHSLFTQEDFLRAMQSFIDDRQQIEELLALFEQQRAKDKEKWDAWLKLSDK